jgi:Putative DNA-binding domain
MRPAPRLCFFPAVARTAGMIPETQLRELLAQKGESRNLDCKERFDWNTATNDAKCELVKDILAFLNTQDGGVILFGVRDSTLELVGLTEDEFASFDTTKVNDFLQKYTDPPSSCEVQKPTIDGRRLVVIGVPEFKDVPVVCKRDANSSRDQSRLILKAGGLYVRTDKATSVLVPSAEEMRNLINRALLKRGDQLLGTIEALLRGKPSIKEPESVLYTKEIESARQYFRDSLPVDFETGGYWDLIAYPQAYNAERITAISNVWKSVAEAEVRLRGWYFPHPDRDTQSNFANGRQSYTVASALGRPYIEAYRAYQSGLFIWRGRYREDDSEFKNQYGKALSFVNVIYEVTEFFVFLKRYYERVAPDAAVHVLIEMHDIDNRRLVSTDFTVELFGNYISRVPMLLIERDYEVAELRASAEEAAIAVVQKIFELFNWNDPDPNMIRGWQQRLLSRTF